MKVQLGSKKSQIIKTKMKTRTWIWKSTAFLLTVLSSENKNASSKTEHLIFIWWKVAEYIPRCSLNLIFTILFRLKSFFCFQDIYIYHKIHIWIFVFPSCPLFPSVTRCLSRWLNINLKVYGIIKWLNNNLKTHIVWYLEKEIKSDTGTSSIDRVLSIKWNIFMENLYRKLVPKGSPWPLFSYGK